MSLPSIIQEWKNTGSSLTYGPFDFNVFVKDIGSPNASVDRILLVLHGFPESSFSFHLVTEGLRERFDRIVLFDMLGYGLSEKPVENYTYSLFEQADLALAVWKSRGIKGGHLLAHDMGDSVATELVTRSVSGILPAWFEDGFQTFTFTNGSMVLDLAELRITQKLLLSRFGYFLRKIPTYEIFHQQVKSAHGNNNLSDQEIDYLWLLNTLNDGHHKTYLTIRYLNDRKRFEKTRWLPALARTETPIHLCWGDDDGVARIEMAHYLKEHVCASAHLTVMNGLGHFCQLGKPQEWLKHILAFYSDNHQKS